MDSDEVAVRDSAGVPGASWGGTPPRRRGANLGPQLLLDAGIPVIDGVGQDVMVRVADGAVVRLDEETLYLGDQVVAKGTPLTREQIEGALTEARALVPVQIASFAA